MLPFDCIYYASIALSQSGYVFLMRDYEPFHGQVGLWGELGLQVGALSRNC